MPLGQNIIKFKHNKLQISHWIACWKRYDRGDTMKWNFEVEPFVLQIVVQREEDIHELKVVKDHMLLWGVVRNEMCCYWLVLRLQKGKDVNQP